MKAFVTGACGFIGSHLAEALVKKGHDVTAMAIYSARDTFGWLDECEGMRKVRGDVRDAEQMRRLIQGHEIVFHLAALGSVPYSYEAPYSVFETNVGGTRNVLEACREAGAKLIHTSTSEVYGTAVYTPQDEKHPIQAQSPYAASKYAADLFVNAYTLTYGMETVTLRPFNTYGPRQSERAVIPSIIRQYLTADSVNLGNVWTRRDFTYVDDTVQAFLFAAPLTGVWNAGFGESITIHDVARKVCGGTKLIEFSENRTRPEESEVGALVADASAFTRKTGWKPTISLDDGIQKTIDWWRSRASTVGVGMVA